MALNRRLYGVLPYKTEYVIITRYWNEDWKIVTKLELLSPDYKGWDVLAQGFYSYEEAQESLNYMQMED